MRAKRKPSQRKPTKKPSRRRARPISAPELVFPVGTFRRPSGGSTEEIRQSVRELNEQVDEDMRRLSGQPPRDTRTFWQRVADFFRGKPRHE